MKVLRKILNYKNYKFFNYKSKIVFLCYFTFSTTRRYDILNALTIILLLSICM